MLAYILSQLSALLSSFESIKTKQVLQRYKSHEHVFYKSLTILLISVPLLFVNWKLTLFGAAYIIYSIAITFFNENFRTKAIQNLEINAFSLLMTLSVFIVYGLELALGRESLELKNIIGLILFMGALAIFLEVKVQDFIRINKVGLWNLLGTLLIISIDRSIGKTAFSEGWLSPEVAVGLRTVVLVVLFYYFARKKGLILKGNLNAGIKNHWSIGLMKYAREYAYNYALVFGSAMMVTLVLNSTLFITFIVSGLLLKESRWKFNRFLGIAIGVVGVVIFQL